MSQKTNLTSLRASLRPYDVQFLADSPYSETFSFSSVDFGAGDVFDLVMPAGLRGKVRGINICNATEVFTIDGRVDVGTTGDPNAYAIGATIVAAAGASGRTPITDGVVSVIPAGSTVRITAVQTGGTPTGIADMNVTIRFFK